MAGCLINKLRYHKITMVFLAVLVLSSSSSARPLSRIAYYHNNLVSSTEPDHLNIALIPDMENIPVSSIKQDAQSHVVPCDNLESTTNSASEVLRDHADHQPHEKRYGIYGSIVLNLLPKGSSPPSGPSKGTNDKNN